jgi:hypothetical protein
MCRWLRVLLLVMAASIAAPNLSFHARAQDSIPTRVDVFYEQEPESGAARIYFVDALSGLSTVANVENGTRFTLVGDYVLFQKPTSKAIMRANPDGTQEPHPFIHQSVGLEAVRWVVSPDGGAIAWVQIDSEGTSEAYAARADGSDLRQLPIESPGPLLTLEPLALTNGMARFYYDQAHTPVLSLETPYAIYDHIAAYSIVEEAFRALPQEPRCLCGAAFTNDGRIFARLVAPDGVGPFELHVWDLMSDAGIIIPAPNLPYRMAGDLLLNMTGTLAVYSVATGVGSESDVAQEQYGLVVVDVVAQQQVLVQEPGPVRYRPLAFIDEDNSLLLHAEPDGGTYKFNLLSGDLQRVSDKTYLGTFMLTP